MDVSLIFLAAVMLFTLFVFGLDASRKRRDDLSEQVEPIREMISRRER